MTRRSTSRGIIYTAPPAETATENTKIEDETGATAAAADDSSPTDTVAADD